MGKALWGKSPYILYDKWSLCLYTFIRWGGRPLKATIEEILGPEGYNIQEFVNSGTSDNATNVVSAVKRMHLTQVGCQAHKVNLAVKASVGGKLPSSRHPDDMEDIEGD